jgi:hypothetical protein
MRGHESIYDPNDDTIHVRFGVRVRRGKQSKTQADEGSHMRHLHGKCCLSRVYDLQLLRTLCQARRNVRCL